MTSVDTDSIIQDLRAAIAGGGNWYRAVLEAVQRWPVGEEVVDGERYVYLLDGEALDLLRL
ncbi:MAG: hypothetical protein M0R22_12605, partial [Dehalococcoidia bacterium]|nr:hypothetical protein [Dehalococcoidia bacterium]